ncbi:MAG: hypothetical protein ACREX4_06720 [Gammaproteobacteria bacterium]
MDQPWMGTPFGEDRFDTRFFSKGIMTSDELDLEPGLRGQPLCMGAQFMAQRLGPTRIVKQTDPVTAQVAGECFAMADLGQSTGDDDTVKTVHTPAICAWCRSRKAFMRAAYPSVEVGGLNHGLGPRGHRGSCPFPLGMGQEAQPSW